MEFVLIMWATGKELKRLGLVALPLPTEPSHQAITPDTEVNKLCIYIHILVYTPRMKTCPREYSCSIKGTIWSLCRDLRGGWQTLKPPHSITVYCLAQLWLQWGNFSFSLTSQCYD